MASTLHPEILGPVMRIELTTSALPWLRSYRLSYTGKSDGVGGTRTRNNWFAGPAPCQFGHDPVFNSIGATGFEPVTSCL